MFGSCSSRLKLQHFFSNQMQQKRFALNAHALFRALGHGLLVMSNGLMNVNPNNINYRN